MKIFFDEKNFKIVGTRINEGKVEKGTFAKIFHEDKEIGIARITALKVVKEDVAEVEKGAECGISLEFGSRIKEGDKVEFFKKEEILKKLQKEGNGKKKLENSLEKRK